MQRLAKEALSSRDAEEALSRDTEEALSRDAGAVCEGKGYKGESSQS